MCTHICSLSLSLDVCVCVFIHMCMYMYIYIHIYICVFMCTYIIYRYVSWMSSTGSKCRAAATAPPTCRDLVNRFSLRPPHSRFSTTHTLLAQKYLIKYLWSYVSQLSRQPLPSLSYSLEARDGQWNLVYVVLGNWSHLVQASHAVFAIWRSLLGSLLLLHCESLLGRVMGLGLLGFWV